MLLVLLFPCQLLSFRPHRTPKRWRAVSQGLEAKEPYKMLAKLAPPIPSAPPPAKEEEE
jgi:hypothetical protein